MKIIAQLEDDFRFYRKLKPGQGFLAVLLDRCFLVCANYRFGYWACHLRVAVIGPLLRSVYVLVNLFISMMNGTDIRSGAIIGRRFDVHTTFGIMIADGVVVGDDCRIYTGVCLVNKANFRGEGQPIIGNNVVLGVGCKVIGGVTIGDNVIVGANAVVLRNVPSDHMAVGVPAHNIPLSPEWEELRAAELDRTP
jgi:serine O-acetyltransferase